MYAERYKKYLTAAGCLLNKVSEGVKEYDAQGFSFTYKNATVTYNANNFRKMLFDLRYNDLIYFAESKNGYQIELISSEIPPEYARPESCETWECNSCGAQNNGEECEYCGTAKA